MTGADLTPVAVYHRRIGASLERVWENVRDWEHLPWLHRRSFASIECLDAGDWGWRARVGLAPAGEPEIEIELRIDAPAQCYVTRTLAGPGQGGEIRTRLAAAGDEATDVAVEFLVPGVAPGQTDAVGAAYVDLYTRLWDEDEAMMQRRAEQLARRAPPPAAGARELALGPVEALRGSLPRVVELAGRRYRLLQCDGELTAHAVVCPHMLGPLDGDDATIEDGAVRCPWHGYRFDLRSGRCLLPRGRGLRLPAAPRVRVDERGEAFLGVEGPGA